MKRRRIRKKRKKDEEEKNGKKRKNKKKKKSRARSIPFVVDVLNTIYCFSEPPDDMCNR